MTSAIRVPRTYRGFCGAWARGQRRLVEVYAAGRTSFIPNLLPELAVRMTAGETLGALRKRLGGIAEEALKGADAAQLAEGPAAGRPDGSWLKASNVVGVNVRTVGSFWNVVKYALTLPYAQDAIHLLPIWEPGVAASLYGMISWKLNPECYSPELAEACPCLDTTEKQLKATVNLLHAMGKAVGMEVIPHTDRFAEIVLANPGFFEWLRREGARIADHRENLHEEVEELILKWLEKAGPAVLEEELPARADELFGEPCPEERRLRLLFGEPADGDGRLRRRLELVRTLHDGGYETVPATMAPPFRGLEVDPGSRTVDGEGREWYDYRLTHPESMSRVFGPLTRYKLYGSKDDNCNWELDFDRPRPEVWRYVCERYGEVQRSYGFDFMRGDMSHVQMRPAGVPATVDEYYDLLGAVKHHVQAKQGVPSFAYLAEAFLAGRNVMLYGDEMDHLDASQADVVLGDLQSTAVGSPAFLQKLCQYRGYLETRKATPCFTLITGDKDDPRFDEYYLKGNVVRMFLGLFLADMPGYMALGFETRDPHPRPAPNEHYSKYYVFQDAGGPKGTQGPYVWGKNGELFHDVTRLRLYAEGVLPELRGRQTRWLIPPDPTAGARHLAWTQASHPQWVFLANTEPDAAVEGFLIPPISRASGARLELEFSTADAVVEADRRLPPGTMGYRVERLEPGEGRSYRIVRAVQP